MEMAIIPIFGPTAVPPATPQNDYNNDLSLGSFIQSKKVWAAVQKRGTAPQIEESRGYLCHIRQAIGASFPMAAETELPPEITDSLDCTHATGEK